MSEDKQAEKQVEKLSAPQGESGFSVNWRMIDNSGQEVQITQRAPSGSDWKRLLAERKEMIELALKAGWQVSNGQSGRSAQATAQPASPSSNGGEQRVIMCQQIIKKMDDDGKLMLRIKGGPYQKHGVALYPEAAEAMGLDIEALPFGPSAFKKKVLVDMEDDKPKRVAGWA